MVKKTRKVSYKYSLFTIYIQYLYSFSFKLIATCVQTFDWYYTYIYTYTCGILNKIEKGSLVPLMGGFFTAKLLSSDYLTSFYRTEHWQENSTTESFFTVNSMKVNAQDLTATVNI